LPPPPPPGAQIGGAIYFEKPILVGGQGNPPPPPPTIGGDFNWVKGPENKSGDHPLFGANGLRSFAVFFLGKRRGQQFPAQKKGPLGKYVRPANPKTFFFFGCFFSTKSPGGPQGPGRGPPIGKMPTGMGVNRAGQNSRVHCPPPVSAKKKKGNLGIWKKPKGPGGPTGASFLNLKKNEGSPPFFFQAALAKESTWGSR